MVQKYLKYLKICGNKMFFYKTFNDLQADVWYFENMCNVAEPELWEIWQEKMHV